MAHILMKKPAVSHSLNRREFIGRTLTVSAGLAAVAGFLPGARAAASAAYPIGIFTRPWAEYDHLTALDAIAEAGFSYCGLMTSKTVTKLILNPNSTEAEAQKVGEECRKTSGGKSSGKITLVLVIATARSMACSNSRTLPGQG